MTDDELERWLHECEVQEMRDDFAMRRPGRGAVEVLTRHIDMVLRADFAVHAEDTPPLLRKIVAASKGMSREQVATLAMRLAHAYRALNAASDEMTRLAGALDSIGGERELS